MTARIKWLFWETLIIVVGVLVALSVDDYWTGLQEQKLEKEYLQRLKIDIQADIDYADDFMANRMTRKLKALDTVAPIVRGRADLPEDMASFLFEVGMGGMGGVSPTPWTTSTTFEDLKGTGNLRLIRDTEMRRKLSDYYRSAEDFNSRQKARVTGYVRFVHSILPAELRADNNIEAMQSFGVERAVERIRSPEFEDLVDQEYNFAWFKIRAYEIQRDAAAGLLDDLNAYLERLDR